MICKSCKENIPFDGFERELCSKCWQLLITIRTKLRQNNRYQLTIKENKEVNKILQALK